MDEDYGDLFGDGGSAISVSFRCVCCVMRNATSLSALLVVQYRTYDGIIFTRRRHAIVKPDRFGRGDQQ